MPASLAMPADGRKISPGLGLDFDPIACWWRYPEAGTSDDRAYHGEEDLGLLWP